MKRCAHYVRQYTVDKTIGFVCLKQNHSGISNHPILYPNVPMLFNIHKTALLNLDSAGWRFVAVVGYLMLIFSCIPTFWQTKISICRSAHSLFVSLRCIHCALLCKSYVCWHSCRCFKTPLSQSGRALVSSDSQSSPTSHTSVSHTIAVKLLPQRVAGHHRSYSSPTEPDR